MKKFFIFVVGLILGFVFFVAFSSWVKALPVDEETTTTENEVKPTDEPTVVEEIEVVEAVDCEKFEDEEECFTTKEKNIKWVTAKAIIDSEGKVFLKIEGETVEKIKCVAVHYKLYTYNGNYVKLGNGEKYRPNETDVDDMVGQYASDSDGDIFFNLNSEEIPASSVDKNILNNIAGLELSEIYFEYPNDEDCEKYIQKEYKRKHPVILK